MCDLGWHALLIGCRPGYERHTSHPQWYCLHVSLWCDGDFYYIRGEGMGHRGQDMWRQHDPAGVLSKWRFDNLPLRTWNKTKHRFERRRRLPDLPRLIRGQGLATQAQARHHGGQDAGASSPLLLRRARPERPQQRILRKAGAGVSETRQLWGRVSWRSPGE